MLPSILCRLVSKNPYAAQSDIKLSGDTKANLITEASADSGYIGREELPAKAAADTVWMQTQVKAYNEILIST